MNNLRAIMKEYWKFYKKISNDHLLKHQRRLQSWIGRSDHSKFPYCCHQKSFRETTYCNYRIPRSKRGLFSLKILNFESGISAGSKEKSTALPISHHNAVYTLQAVKS
ncbi:hypothetical protein [Chryseobacterium gambrini]|uniref:hypothetical protein n=1 Tax=Chryseobacterium gambrini TaxID=373672 RepID=UPI0022F3A3FB|nr:hypothetical protein [Chryseobacterium gambrini]WBX98244.1 hypothetical protein PE065_03065 [Chryseobacterium gambrini]